MKNRQIMWCTTMAWDRFLSKPLFALGLFLILGTILAGLIFKQLQEERIAKNWVLHTYEVINNTTTLNQDITNAESLQRGYIVTRDPAFFAAFSDTVREGGSIDQTVAAIENLIQDNSSQINAFEELKNRIYAKRDFMRQSVALIQEKGIEVAKKKLGTGKGLILMSRVQNELQNFTATERALFAARKRIAERVSIINNRLTIAMSLFMFTVIITAFLAIQKELKRRHLLEKSLHDTMMFQKVILDSAAYAITVCNVDGTIRMFNPAAERMTGYMAEELIGHHNPSIFHDKAEMLQRAADLTREFGRPVLPSIEVFTLRAVKNGMDGAEWTYLHKNGKRIDVFLTITPLRDKRGEITGYFGIANDIGERKQIERMKNEFISTVSHELRTPLTSIRGSLGLITGTMMESIPTGAQQLITIAHKNTERLVRLINNILDIEKIEAGNMVFDHRALSVMHVIDLALEEMMPLARKNDIKITVENLANSPEIIGDEDRLLQVIDNLLSNAIKFSAASKEVRIIVERNNDVINICVKDSGTGIPDEFKARVFEKFAQADSSDTRKLGGSGLGLSISKSIIESMDGTINFTSRPGETVFKITLPTRERMTQIEERRPDGRTILICEDDPAIAELLSMSLRNEGYDTEIAYTAGQAKTLLKNGRYLAMTLDLTLPDQDGLILIEELRIKAETAKLPIIIISASADDQKKKWKGDAFGIVGWLQKPIDQNHLLRLVKSLHIPHMPRILFIEDEPDIIEVIATALNGVAYIDSAGTLAQARAAMRKRTYDLAILDLLLPDGNGLDLLPELSREPSTPVVILSVLQTAHEVQQKVMASLVKTVVPEQKIIETIKSLIERGEP